MTLASSSRQFAGQPPLITRIPVAGAGTSGAPIMSAALAESTRRSKGWSFVQVAGPCRPQPAGRVGYPIARPLTPLNVRNS